MARKPRKKSESQKYHVILRGNNKQNIFFNDADRLFMLNRIKKYAEQTEIELYAFCLMDNHIHLLLGKANPNLSKFVQKLATSYAMYFNRKYEHSGHLFQGRFKSEPVDSDEYFKTVFRYILQNPCKANICDVFQYKWSSIHLLFNKSEELPLNREYVISFFQNEVELKKYLQANTSDVCMEYENVPKISDSFCINMIKEKFRIDYPAQIKTYNNGDMQKALQYLKKYGINVTQISRITGISRQIVASA